jgi:hypothetical protein
VSRTLMVIGAAILAAVVLAVVLVMPSLPPGGLGALHQPPPGAHGSK